jgi:hypothetical protein
MPDYSKTIIYKLCCKNLDVKDIYIGSTCNFTRRKNGHKTDCHNQNYKKYNTKVYKFIRENGGFDNWEMIMVEEYPCDNKLQKVKRERYWCEELKSTLNTEVPGRDIKEWYQDNREKISKREKEYQKNNAEKIKEHKKEYQKNNAEKIKEYKKEYDKNNSDKIKEQKKIYYEANKEKILQKARESRERKKNELLT